MIQHSRRRFALPLSSLVVLGASCSAPSTPEGGVPTGSTAVPFPSSSTATPAASSAPASPTTAGLATTSAPLASTASLPTSPSVTATAAPQGTASASDTPAVPSSDSDAGAATAEPSSEPAPTASATQPGTSASTAPSTPPVTGDAPCPVPDYIFSETEPVGWASEGGGTTGGGDAPPTLVTSLSQLQSEVEGSGAKTLYIQGDIAKGVLDVGSNKTLIGCTGASIGGRMSIGEGSSNIIVRNLEFVGYAVGNCSLDPEYDSSEGCSSGSDAVGVNGDAHHVWFDHCSVRDGTDGNLDITNDANFVTVSWTKFSYTPRQDNEGGDSTGAAGHRFSNLVGGSDDPPTDWPDVIPLNVTWHHNWWADNVVERQPRVRYGRNHLFNNYYSSSVSNYCVRAGIEASVLLEANYFDGVETPHEFNEDDADTAFIARGSGAKANIYDGTSGDQAIDGEGEPFTPPYAFTVDPAADVPAAVKAGAGPH